MWFVVNSFIYRSLVKSRIREIGKREEEAKFAKIEAEELMLHCKELGDRVRKSHNSVKKIRINFSYRDYPR